MTGASTETVCRSIKLITVMAHSNASTTHRREMSTEAGESMETSLASGLGSAAARRRCASLSEDDEPLVVLDGIEPLCSLSFFGQMRGQSITIDSREPSPAHSHRRQLHHQ